MSESVYIWVEKSAKNSSNQSVILLFTFFQGNMGGGLAGGYDSDVEGGLGGGSGGFGEKAVSL